jgi:flap endonuclease-1
MDTLTFGGSILYRHLIFSEAKKAPIMEVNLERALEGLDMDMSTVCFRAVVLVLVLFCSVSATKYLIFSNFFFRWLVTSDLPLLLTPQFIDLCILLGCDYLEPIRGVGPKSALKLIREHNGLAGVIKHLREK